MEYKQSEVLAEAMKIDPVAGKYLALSLVERISYDTIEKRTAKRGERIPVSRTSFYRERRQLLQNLEKQMIWENETFRQIKTK